MASKYEKVLLMQSHLYTSVYQSKGKCSLIFSRAEGKVLVGTVRKKNHFFLPEMQRAFIANLETGAKKSIRKQKIRKREQEN